MSNAIASITSGASSLVSTGLKFGGQAVTGVQSFALASGRLFVAYVNTPATSLIGTVVAKANTLGSPLLGPAAGVATTFAIGLLANRLFHLSADNQIQSSSIATLTVKAIAIALAVFAGCAAAATVTAASAAIIPAAYAAYASYAAYVVGGTVIAACFLLGENREPAPAPATI